MPTSSGLHEQVTFPTCESNDDLDRDNVFDVRVVLEASICVGDAIAESDESDERGTSILDKDDDFNLDFAFGNCWALAICNCEGSDDPDVRVAGLSSVLNPWTWGTSDVLE